MFNIGDKVRVREDIADHAEYGCNDEMEMLAGSIVTITDVIPLYDGRTKYRISEDGCEWAWGESDFVRLDEGEIVDAVIDRNSIKEKWSKYCDTDKLINDMMALLTKYHHRNSEHGVCKIIEEFFTNKEPLINMLKKSPNYKGNLRIMFKEEFVRENARGEIQRFVREFMNSKEVADCIISYKDKDGKAINDYITTGVKSFAIKDIDKAKDIMNSTNIALFSKENGATIESLTKNAHFRDWMNYMYRVCIPTISEDKEDDGIKVSSGMKTSRAFNRICTNYGVNKWSKYDKEFAKYADMVSGKQRQLYFIISANPLDYLTMSFGNSWASCHTIDKTNKRRMPNSYSGQYCGGTLSYMLDTSSFITYCLDDIDGDLHDKGKIYRNMFHMNGQKFVQSRIYPQGNDGATDLYKKFREVVQREFVPIFGLDENKWKVRDIDASDDVTSSGTHYRDYVHFRSKVFYPTGYDNHDLVINIGHYGICPKCGIAYTNSSNLSHGSC